MIPPTAYTAAADSTAHCCHRPPLPPPLPPPAPVARIYTGALGSEVGAAMAACDPSGPLMINVVKLLSSPDGQSFHALGRVYSGTVRLGASVRVLGEAYSLDDEEDMAVCEVGLWSKGVTRRTWLFIALGS